MKKIYYTVKKQLTSSPIDGVEETTGLKDITIYEILDGQPKIFAEIEAQNECSSEEEIITYLDNNGFENELVEFEEL